MVKYKNQAFCVLWPTTAPEIDMDIDSTLSLPGAVYWRWVQERSNTIGKNLHWATSVSPPGCVELE